MKKRRFSYYHYLLCFVLLGYLSACEDVIDIDLDEGTPQLSVDTWLTDQSTPQVIKLRRTRGFFDNGAAPPALGASVSVEDSEGNVFNFTDPENDGDYTWTPSSPTEVLGVLGRDYTLTLTYEGETYQATSSVRRTPRIDSLVYEFREERLGNPDGYYASIYARDPVGAGDCYWIRTFKNGEFINRAQDINLAYDAGFSPGGNIDGLYFITPIREGINSFVDDGNDGFLPPYELGDHIRVEIYSITEDAYFFFQEVRTQLTNGGLFAVPLTNVRTNLINQNPNSTQKAVGYFGVSAKVEIETTVEE